MKMTTQAIVKTAAIAAIYVVITVAFSFMSYGNIQFRLSEMMTLFVFFDPFYIVGLTIGCFIANLLGPGGVTDAVVGSLATFVSVVMITVTSRVTKQSKIGLWIASLWPTLFNSLFIGFMLNKLFQFPLILTMIQVGVGEFVVITLAGIPVFQILLKKYSHVLNKLIKN